MKDNYFFITVVVRHVLLLAVGSIINKNYKSRAAAGCSAAETVARTAVETVGNGAFFREGVIKPTQ